MALSVAVVGCMDSDSGSDNTILKAVPTDAAVIVKTASLADLTDIANKGNVMWAQLRNLPSLKGADNVLKLVDTLLKKSSELRGAVHGKDVVVSFHLLGRNQIASLAAVTVSKQEAERLYGIISKVGKQSGLVFTNDQYSQTTIYQLVDSKDKSKVKLCFSYIGSEDIFVISTSRLMVDASVRHIRKGNVSIGSNRLLKNLLKSEGKNVKASLIVNYQYLNNIMKAELSQSVFQKREPIASFAEWSIFDISPKPQTIVCSGFSNCTDKEYLAMFNSQQPVSNDFVKYLPSKTTQFSSVGISDFMAFKHDYVNYLKSVDGYLSYKSSNDGIRKKYGVNIEDDFYSLFSGRMTEFVCDYSLAGRGYDQYLVAELDRDEDTEVLLSTLTRKYQKEQNLPDNKVYFDIVSNSNKKFKAYFMPVKNLVSVYFGDIFQGEYSYFVIYRDKLVFGQNISGLKEYINSVETKKVLSENSNYVDFSELIMPKSNVFYYVDIPYSQSSISQKLNKANAAEYAANQLRLQNFRSFALQYGRYNDMFYTNSALKYSQIIESERCVSWISPIDTIVRAKPQVVINHTNSDREIFTQDATNKIYLINRDGKILWKKQLPEPIVGSVSQIDYLENGKLQYMFATENFLHLIDRNGNYVDNYPVKLPAQLSAEISVCDYDNNKNYRIFVPCSNNRLYVYTKDGVQLDSWKPVETQNNIIVPVQHFVLNSNDYLVFSDNLKTYILNRRGETRINVTNNFPKAKNSKYYVEAPGGIENMRFVTTNSSGEIVYIRMDGSCKTKSFKHYSAEHSFVMEDINGDGEKEYIFTDGGVMDVFNSSGSLLFNYYFDGRITHKPNVFSFASNDKRIGITCAEQDKIFLFDSKGKICSGFPLVGGTEFSITKLNNSNKYSVITGGSENFLYNYFIQ